MSFKKVCGIVLMYLMILGNNVGISEWIELPQFSGEKKVYRGSFAKYDRDKLLEEGQLNAQKYAFPNSSNYFDKIKETSTFGFKYEVSTSSMKNIEILTSDDNEKKVTTTVANYSNDDDSIVTEENEEIGEILEKPEITEKEENITKLPSTKNSSSTPPPKSTKSTPSFFDYLPIEFFKKIHRNLLRNQARSSEGKIGLLKSFESTLLNEMKTRLTPFINPVRKKRGSGWNDNDDHVGFPSLEGALLTISFLTFAVYLVQLVMTLFRNLANNQMPANTFLVNRNKRWTNDLHEESIRILEYLDKKSKLKNSPFSPVN